jgi:hypothetical protein
MMSRFLLLAVLVAAACSRSHPTAASSPAQAEADNIFTTRCTPCHGPNGRGDGPASASLSPHPRNFTDKSWQSSVNDEHIQKIIQYGGAAVGKSPNMPANPDLQSKPQVVSELAKKVRSFGQ